MKKDGKYRYTLQFDDSSEENQLVGDFLERLGNKKSPVIVDALIQYLKLHPEVAGTNGKIKITVNPALSWTDIESKIRSIIDEKISVAQTSDGLENTGSPPVIADEDIDEMLHNLDLFDQ